MIEGPSGEGAIADIVRLLTRKRRGRPPVPVSKDMLRAGLVLEGARIKRELGSPAATVLEVIDFLASVEALAVEAGMIDKRNRLWTASGSRLQQSVSGGLAEFERKDVPIRRILRMLLS